MKKKLIIVSIAALIIFSAYMLIPLTSSAPRRTIQIGVIASSTEGLETTAPLFKKIIEPDINEYMRKLPRNMFSQRTEFEFLIEDAQGSAAIHQEKVEQFHSMGVDLIIGGFWSSQAYRSLDYVNDNDMLLISPSSTSTVLAIPDDNLFRLCPDDTIQGALLARMISSHESAIENVIVIQRDDLWGNGLYDVFQAEYEGTILGRFVYPPETTNFHNYLTGAEDAAAGMENVGVILISYDETNQIITEASEGDYPNIYNPLWFGTKSTGRSQRTLEEAPDQAVHLKLLSALSAPPSSSKYRGFRERYLDRTGQEPSFYAATMVDAAWLLAQAVLETQFSTSGTDIAKVFPNVASRHYGYSGWTHLNDAGDRESSNFDIWGFYREADGIGFKRYGLYDGVTSELTWYD